MSTQRRGLPPFTVFRALEVMKVILISDWRSKITAALTITVEPGGWVAVSTGDPIRAAVALLRSQGPSAVFYRPRTLDEAAVGELRAPLARQFGWPGDSFLPSSATRLNRGNLSLSLDGERLLKVRFLSRLALGDIEAEEAELAEELGFEVAAEACAVAGVEPTGEVAQDLHRALRASAEAEGVASLTLLLRTIYIAVDKPDREAPPGGRGGWAAGPRSRGRGRGAGDAHLDRTHAVNATGEPLRHHGLSVEGAGFPPLKLSPSVFGGTRCPYQRLCLT